jgi:hypothetical protein
VAISTKVTRNELTRRVDAAVSPSAINFSVSARRVKSIYGKKVGQVALDFSGNDYPITLVLHWASRIEEQHERLRSRIAINRLCRRMYRQRSKQNIVPITEGSSAMRGDPKIGASFWRAGFSWC